MNTNDITELKMIGKEVQGFGFPRGWGNGYVLIPKGYKSHGVDYDTLNKSIEIHGGLTFSEEVTDEPFFKSIASIDSNDVGKWMVGFDTAHYGDSLEKWTIEEVEKETLRLRDQLFELEFTRQLALEE